MCPRDIDGIEQVDGPASRVAERSHVDSEGLLIVVKVDAPAVDQPTPIQHGDLRPSLVRRHAMRRQPRAR